MENEELQENGNPTGNGNVSSGSVEVRIDPAELTVRPLSQFILSKQYDGISANPELIRPVTLVASVRPVESRKSGPCPSPSAPAPARRIEYPFYDDEDSDSPFPFPEESPAEKSGGAEEMAEPETAGTNSAGGGVCPPEVPAVSAGEPVGAGAAVRAGTAGGLSVPETAPPSAVFRTDLPPALVVRYSSVSPEESAAPLLSDRGRTEKLPIFDYFLSVSPSRN